MKLQIYIDEAGRGPLAGPVYTGLILVLENFDKTIFQDSKQLNEKKREQYYNTINTLEKERKIIFSSGNCSNTEIDEKGITNALNLSIKRGIRNILLKYFHINNNPSLKTLIQKLSYKGEKINSLIIDGNNDFRLEKDLNIKTLTIKKGDQKIPFISMASIVAKVERDSFMQKLHTKYPYYGFDKHKGYGTQKHITNIKKYGICAFHRKSFLKKYL